MLVPQCLCHPHPLMARAAGDLTFLPCDLRPDSWFVRSMLTINKLWCFLPSVSFRSPATTKLAHLSQHSLVPYWSAHPPPHLLASLLIRQWGRTFPSRLSRVWYKVTRLARKQIIYHIFINLPPWLCPQPTRPPMPWRRLPSWCLMCIYIIWMYVCMYLKYVAEKTGKRCQFIMSLKNQQPASAHNDSGTFQYKLLCQASQYTKKNSCPYPTL